MQGQINPVAFAGLTFPREATRLFVFSQILESVCKAHELTKADVLSKKRNRELVYARYNFMYEAKRRTTASLTEIGRFLGRHYSSVIAGLEQHYMLMRYHDYSLRALRTSQIYEGVAEVAGLPKSVRHYEVNPEELYNELLHATSDYSGISSRELDSAATNLIGASNENTRYYARLIRYIYKEKTNSLTTCSRVLRCSKSSIGDTCRAISDDLRHNRAMFHDYKTIKASL